MFIAIDENGKTIDIYDALNKESAKYYCPLCRGELKFKNGTINTCHFAHVSLEECDAFGADMSEWHRSWQLLFPIENNGIKHRADVCIGKYVIEFQHSKISQIEFDTRNGFYTDAGYKVIWIIDVTDEYDSERIECYGEWSKYGDNGGKFKWLYPFKFMQNWNPKYDKNVIVFLQLWDWDFTDMEQNTIEKVTGVIEDDYGNSSFKRFFTSYYPGDVSGLKDYIQKKKAVIIFLL